MVLDNQAITKALESVSENYESVGILCVIANRLLDRLDFIRLDPVRVVDFGSRTGYTTRALLNRYKNSDVVSLDFSLSLLKSSKKCFRSRLPKMLVAEYTLLPFSDQSVDLIFSNLTFQWSSDLQKTLLECKRILKPEGFLLFSTVGPDTLKELRESFSDEKQHVHSFYDMHDIGDILTQLHFIDPVVDVDYLTVRYSSVLQIIVDLKSIGAHNVAQNRARGLMGKSQWEKMLQAYEKYRDENCLIPVTIEVVYGHAFIG
ncbi:methyltransferase domain-containing protein [Coxiella endosymbiont of Amblyomma sculptum]|uniref:methyltransferase domain-containing protein n=1 Tax=Coxiella endosymbiont of Amblyomma sculptum TaxID=2487929 RepID=UPI00132F344C|nr:methyltransferase domain-containing protein [Coxiella endosymbiont of Amblyomma sculptum]QHG92505.1 methyltransferase domain-containing protein [Coxiella endosymbiont of Amblyomma sculptum]